MMSGNNSMKTKARFNSARINAAKAAKKIPIAILLERKAKCDAEALKIVERLIEPQINLSWLLEKLGQINRSHLQDVIEERAILKYCGYILCDNPLTKVVNKRYEISTRRNKVYDIQCMKNFCTFWCYSASEYLLDQMLTSPLWLRNQEQQIPHFRIFSEPKEKLKNAPGIEINLSSIDLSSDIDKLSVSEVKERNYKTTSSESTIEKVKAFNPIDSVSDECSTKIDVRRTDSELDLTEEGQIDVEKERMEIMEKSVQIQTKIPIKKSKIPEKTKKFNVKSPISYKSLTIEVEKNMTEWITDDTIILLHGEDSMKQRILQNITIQDKYGELYKKLNSIQLEEKKEDRLSAIQSNILKPAPDFAVLKEEARDLELKVQGFYQGNSVIQAPIVKQATDNEVENTVIPLTEGHEPAALRRRIFLNKLNKILPDLLRTLSGPGQFQYIYTPESNVKIKALVHTFKLSATNIVFKTAQWTLVGLLIIKLLSIIDDKIKRLLYGKQAAMNISMILMSYKLDSNYLDQLITSLTIAKNSREIDNNSHS